MPKAKPITDVVKTRGLLIYDDSDRLRISLDAIGGVNPKITIYKEDGTPAIEISSLEMDSDSRRIILFGKAHKWRLWITCTNKGVGMTVYDKEGKILRSWDLEAKKTKPPEVIQAVSKCQRQRPRARVKCALGKAATAVWISLLQRRPEDAP